MEEAERESWTGQESRQPQCGRWTWVICAKGIRPFHVQKPNFSEDYPEAAIREGADELTLKAEELGTLKACIHIDHTEDDRWRPPLVHAD